MIELRKPMYPVFLQLQGKKCLVVGGGKVAERKIESLLESSAHVVVVSPEVTGGIADMDAACMIELEKREYRPGEAAAYMLVIAATDNHEVNWMISDDAQSAGRLVNVVDVPELCNFYVPSVVRRGELQLAISTAGAMPALARKIREDLEEQLPEAYDRLIVRLRAFRSALMKSEPDEAKRKETLGSIVRSPQVQSYLEGDDGPLEELLSECV